MDHHGSIRFAFAFLFIAVLSLPAAAQQDDRVQKLEQKLDALMRQAAEIRQELDAIKGTTTPPSDDLTQIDVATPAPTEPAQTADTAVGNVQPVDNVATPGASKALNPDISVIGTFLSHAGDQFEDRAPAELDEVEVAYEAFIDPYAKGKFFIAVTPEEVDVEEGYAQFLTLPWGLTAKAGKTKATFGKVNTWHTHTRPWVDQPLMFTRFLGDEGLADVGVSVSKLIPNPVGVIEATGEIYSGDVEGVFGRTKDNDLFYNGHLKLFRDITENSNLELGTSWAQGTLPDVGGRNRLAGVDVTYRWKPLERSIYRSLIVRAEGIANRRADFNRSLYGYYLAADYQVARRWFAGARIDRADRFEPELESGRFSDRGYSATLTFWPSEFSQVRGQYRRTTLDHGPSFDEFLLQLQFAIGAHGAHTF
jgi:hypothetical protein